MALDVKETKMRTGRGSEHSGDHQLEDTQVPCDIEERILQECHATELNTSVLHERPTS